MATNLVTVNIKFPLCFTKASRHEQVLGNGGIAPHIPNLGIRWR
jgi:hypothetical protein